MTWLIGISSLIRWAFSKQGLIVIAIFAAVSLLGWSHWRTYSAGVEHGSGTAVNRINQDNENAAQSAEKWRDRYRRCADAGRVYDFETGTCQR